MIGHTGLCLVSAIIALAVADASGVTPVEKVTQLLDNLANKIEQEGKDEAAAYDKYACFCKEQADDKQYAIEASAAKLVRLTDKITKLTVEISDLDGDIQDLGDEAIAFEGFMSSRKLARQAAHATFQTNVADANSALDAVQRAIKALKDSKKAQLGKVELEALELSQIAKVALSQQVGLSQSDVGVLSLLAAADEPGTAYTYKYHSNDIIATLGGLRTTFAKRKASLEDDEFRAQSEYELNQQHFSNQKKFAEKERREKQQVRESKAEEKEATELDKSDEQRDKASDEAFLEVVQTNCQDTAALWDQRSQTRAGELTAISKAVEALKTGVAPNWQANKKLVGLQTTRAVKGKSAQAANAAPAGRAASPVSFVQLYSTRHRLRGSAQVAGQVRERLARSAAQLHSPLLSMAALKVQAAEDHFVKVRQIIKDLMQHLEDQATAEEDHKSFCDREISTAVEKRDREQSEVEDVKAQISVKKSNRAQLKRDIAELSKQIAKNKKALNEATELRQDENAENTKTIKDAGAGKEAVEFALGVLRDFYQGAALLQRSHYVPPNSDREGLTVADRAPEVFDAEYNGSQEASKGIIGMLEVIVADFDRTGTTVDGQELDAQGKFQTFEQTNTQDTRTKKSSVDTKQDQVRNINDDLVTLRDSLSSAKKAHDTANAELDKLHSMCIAGEETYEERVAQRNKEIEALKEAHGILEDWQK